MATTAEATFVKPRKRRRSGLSERRLAAAMVSPSLIVILVVAASPVAYAIWLSLHQYSVIHPGLSRWVGFTTTATRSSQVTSGARSRPRYLQRDLGFARACAGDGNGAPDARRVPRTRPDARRGAGAMGDPDAGYRAHSGRAGLRLPQPDPPGTPSFPVRIPFMALLPLLAGLQMIPDDLEDAAKVDGASARQRFVRTLDALRIFDLPYVLTQGAGRRQGWLQ